MSTPRPYRSDLRQQQAERTKELIAESARRCFLDKGWAGTSIRAVAEGAGVSEATVYHVYGGKVGVASALIDAAERSAQVDVVIAELQERSGDPAGQLRAFVAFDRRLYEHGGDVIRILAEGRRQYPELDAAYLEGRGRGDSQRRRVFGSWPAKTWRRGVNAERAVEIYGVIVNLDSFATATREYAWSTDQVEAWWHSSLVTLLFR